MYPKILEIGPLPGLGFSLTIYSFGLMMALGFLLGGYIVGREMRRKGLPAELASNLVFWGAVGGVGGSRLWALAEDWQAFLRDPVHELFRGSGFVWYGGFLFATALVSAVIFRHGLPWLKVVDCIAPALAIGHAVGRIGCQLAGDGDWGKVSEVPWAMAYPNAIVGWDFPPGVRVHPTPVYEMLAYSFVFVFLWKIRTRQAVDGTVFWWYLALAPACRFLIEFVRVNKPILFGVLTEAQIVSLILVAIGTWGLVRARLTRPAVAR